MSLMQKAGPFISTILFAFVSVAAQAISDDFLLTDMRARDTLNQLDIAITPIRFSSQITGYSQLPKSPFRIGLFEAVQKPFHIRATLSEQFKANARLTVSPYFSAGFELGTDLQKTKYDIDNQTRIESGTTIPAAISFEKANHTRTNTSANLTPCFMQEFLR